MRGKAVAQCMGRYIRIEPRIREISFHHALHRARRQPPSVTVQEQRGRRAFFPKQHPKTVAALHRRAQRAMGRPAERTQPFLLPFTAHLHHAGQVFHLLIRQPRQFTDPHPRAVEQLQDRRVAGAHVFLPDPVARIPYFFRSGTLLRGRLEQPPHFVHAQHARQLAPALWNQEPGKRIHSGMLFPQQKSEERSQTGNFPPGGRGCHFRFLETNKKLSRGIPVHALPVIRRLRIRPPLVRRELTDIEYITGDRVEGRIPLGAKILHKRSDTGIAHHVLDRGRHSAGAFDCALPRRNGIPNCSTNRSKLGTCAAYRPTIFLSEETCFGERHLRCSNWRASDW